MGIALLAAITGIHATAARDAYAQDPLAARLSDAPSGIEPPAALAPLAGALTAVLPFVAGSLMVAQDDNPGRQRDGITLMTMGFAAAPWVAQSRVRGRRAVLIGLASAATSVGTLLAMAARDPFDPTIGNHKRLAFGFFLTASFFLAAGGIADGFIASASPQAP